MIGRHFLTIALKALVRNRMQTVLAMIGLMVGVGALVTSLALGRGAQQSVEDQLRAAGANLIVVTAGNYGGAKEDRSDPDGNIGHTSIEPDQRQWQVPGYGDGPMMRVAWHAEPYLFYRDPMRAAGAELSYPAPYGFVPADGAPRLQLAHYEDDPLAIHDHPTAKDRLGDTEAGLGAAATLTREDAAAILAMPGVQHVVSGVHENAPCLHLLRQEDVVVHAPARHGMGAARDP